MSITLNTIIIVETENIINCNDFLKIINNFGDIYLNYNNHIEKINHGSSKKSLLKVITYKELLMELSEFDNKTINYFIEHGLNKNTNPKGNITLIITTNRNKTKLETYDFSYKDKNKNLCYDIPYYHKNVPEGFSVFCTDEEFDLVINHVNKRDAKAKSKNKKKEEILSSEPEPSKKNFICQLCRSRFSNYRGHIISDTHIKNIKKHKNSFNKLSLTFKRIVNNNFSISKGNNIINEFSNQFTNDDINDLFVFSPQDYKKNNSKQNYNLRIKKTPSFGKDDNYINYFMSSSKNNNIKIIRNENDYWSPQQQVSTASSTFKNVVNLLDDISDITKNNSSIKKNSKRRRDEEEDVFYEQLNSRNKRLKLFN